MYLFEVVTMSEINRIEEVKEIFGMNIPLNITSNGKALGRIVKDFSLNPIVFDQQDDDIVTQLIIEQQDSSNFVFALSEAQCTALFSDLKKFFNL